MHSKFPVICLLSLLLGSACAPDDSADDGIFLETSTFTEEVVSDVGTGTTEIDSAEECKNKTRPDRQYVTQLEALNLTAPGRCALLSGPLNDVRIAWESNDANRFYVGIFSDFPEIVYDQIANPSRIVWAWSTGSNRVNNGEVTLGEGFRPDDYGLPDISRPPPTSLNPNFHWIMAWSWDEQRNLKAMSEPRAFFWQQEPLEATNEASQCSLFGSGQDALPKQWCVPDNDAEILSARQCQDVFCETDRP